MCNNDVYGCFHMHSKLSFNCIFLISTLRSPYNDTFIVSLLFVLLEWNMLFGLLFGLFFPQCAVSLANLLPYHRFSIHQFKFTDLAIRSTELSDLFESIAGQWLWKFIITGHCVDCSQTQTASKLQAYNRFLEFPLRKNTQAAYLRFGSMWKRPQRLGAKQTNEDTPTLEWYS